MLPKDVLEIVRQELGWDWLEDQTFKEPTDEEINEVIGWLLSPNTDKSTPVRKYLFFLKSMYETFLSIYALFPKFDEAEGKTDLERFMIATIPDEMVYMANYLYILDSYGVQGGLMECGCFKGYSSCCLSHVCAYLGRELYLTDSFEGLPLNTKNDKTVFGHLYREGELVGTVDEVKRHIEMFGRPEVVSYVKGFYSDSLKDWNKPLAMLWLDVDLYDSVMDVMNYAFPHLDPQAALFSHEIREHRVKDGKFSVRHGPAGAYIDYFADHKIDYHAKWLTNCLAQVSFGSTIAHSSSKFLGALLPRLHNDDPRVNELLPQVRNLQAELTQHKTAVTEQDSQLAQAKTQLSQREAEVKQLNASVAEKESHIQGLLNGRVMKLMLGVQSKAESLLKSRNGH